MYLRTGSDISMSDDYLHGSAKVLSFSRGWGGKGGGIFAI